MATSEERRREEKSAPTGHVKTSAASSPSLNTHTHTHSQRKKGSAAHHKSGSLRDVMRLQSSLLAIQLTDSYCLPRREMVKKIKIGKDTKRILEG